MEEEQARRVEELSKLSAEEIEQRVAVSSKLLDVQKELLGRHKPVKVGQQGRRRKSVVSLAECRLYPRR